MLISYYFIRDRVPFVALALLYLKRSGRLDTDGVMKAIMVAIGVLPVLSFILGSDGIARWTGLRIIYETWTTIVVLEYSAYIVLTYLTLKSKDYDDAFSGAYALVTVSAIGYLYELPRFLLRSLEPGRYLHLLALSEYNVALITSEIISIYLAVYLMSKETGYEADLFSLLGALLYVVYFVVALIEIKTVPADYRTLYSIPVARIPTMVSVTLLMNGIPSRRR